MKRTKRMFLSLDPSRTNLPKAFDAKAAGNIGAEQHRAFASSLATQTEPVRRRPRKPHPQAVWSRDECILDQKTRHWRIPSQAQNKDGNCALMIQVIVTGFNA